ncbi:MAG: hypothetical protein HYX28_02750 [Candidatus Koribacter versatilis]|uniref:Uncharacterized protein n=1 Tax=Candidatus Korobacter versatilis TaxID=658062 RepID=A0A932EQB1_9BACT|nr:hypothetical protein [Candidatus Koribacter versatilis]
MAMLALLGLAVLVVPAAQAAQVTINLTTNGLPVGGSKAAGYTWNMGAMNGLGVGTPAANVTIATPISATGAIYESSINFVISGLPGPHLTAIKGFVSTPFPAAAVNALRAVGCSNNCGAAAGSYAVLGNSLATAATLQTSTDNGTVIGNIGIQALNLNGASAFTGSATVTVSIVALDTTNGNTDTVTLAITVNSQNAMRLALSTGAAAPNCTVSPANNIGPYSINFGSVNGVGVTSSACVQTTGTNPVVYFTNYRVTPTWSGFTSGTNGTLTAYVSTDFVNNTFLKIREAATSAGLTTNMSTNAGAPQTLGTAGAIVSATPLSRVLGVAVTPNNTFVPAGGGTSDSAVITYTLMVP